MRFIVHELGDWVRNDEGTSATRTEDSISEYASLGDEDMHPFDRVQFAWMQSIGEICMSSGSTIWQIEED